MDSIIESIYNHKEKGKIVLFLVEEDAPRSGWTQIYADEMNYIYDIFKNNNIDFSSNSDILYDIQKQFRDN